MGTQESKSQLHLSTSSVLMWWQTFRMSGRSHHRAAGALGPGCGEAKGGDLETRVLGLMLMLLSSCLAP